MDLYDLDDPYDLYDPDYGDDMLALWGEPDLSDLDDEDVVGSGSSAGELGQPLLHGSLLKLGRPWALARPSTIRQYNEAMGLGVQRLRTLRANQRAAAAAQSYNLEDTFLECEQCSTHSAPSPDLPGSDGCNISVRTWLQARQPALQSLRNLTLWVRCAGIAILPAIELGSIFFLFFFQQFITWCPIAVCGYACSTHITGI